MARRSRSDRITDPKQISSKPNAQVEQNQPSLSIERLYMTRSVGATAWSPDGKTIAFRSDHRSQADKQQAQRPGGAEPAESFYRKALHDAFGRGNSLVAGWQDDRVQIGSPIPSR